MDPAYTADKRAQTRERAITCPRSTSGQPHNNHSINHGASSQHDTAAGEDLRKYLILPSQLSSSSSFTTSPYQSHYLPFSPPSDLRSTVSGQIRVKMEMETAPANNLGVGGAGGALDRIFSIDDYMATHAEDMSKEKAAVEASGRATRPTNKNRTLVPVGARSSKHICQLNDKCQGLSIGYPEFVFSGDSIQGWSVQMRFLGSDSEWKGPFPSKQQGKEAMSEMALAVLAEKEKKGAWKGKRKGKDAVNWIGRLLEFHRAIAAPEPIYNDYQLGTSFTCLVTMDGYPSPFGSQSVLFLSKKAARQHAAECAFKHLQGLGLCSEGMKRAGGTKRRKSAAVDSHKSIVVKNDPKHPSNTSGDMVPKVSFAQRAAELSTQLSLGAPEWRYSPSDPAAPGFHTVACYFKSGGLHQGPIGEVRHIHGKKNAKEECARNTVVYLIGVRDRRLSYGQKMMMGVEGGEGVAGVAALGGFEGEDSYGWEKQRIKREEEEHEEEGDVDPDFTDAYEFLP
ncbi:hypothetical protein K505DRAFT_413993 [Melanomma pulvis-pyrius CBS 109.77]|uniref:DRBM domain-containing protein n=1 Tax=Melanomma pulvis-pyrius CBS 109.77 TaxID=1314802 RepID=A0A6A6XQW1_9PLEO|nr:hypothetical protein K505DRAFT_413993 [Melanomma pulvis-pyrius CBS 109.77]